MRLRREAGLDLVELRIVTVILIVLALVSLPFLASFTAGEKKRQEAVDTLRARLGGTEGPAVADAEVYTRDGVRALRQTLPPLPAEIGGIGGVIRLEGTTLLVTTRWWARWLIGPLIALVALAGVAGLVLESFGRRKERLQHGLSIAFLLLAGTAGIALTREVTRWELDAPRARLTKTRRAFGFWAGPGAVVENTAAVAAVPAGDAYAVVAFPREGAPVELCRVEAASRGVAGRLNDALGRR